MAQLEPSLEEVLVAVQDYGMANIYTSIPGIIVTVVSLDDMIVDVQPSLNMRSQDGDEVSERPPILNVPFKMPLTKQGGLSFPISVGTPVYLHFSMRGLDAWKRSNGYPSTPLDVRKFDIRDCVASPGTYPFSESPNHPSKRTNDHDPNDVVLVHNIGTANEVEIRLKSGSGKVVINTIGDVEVNCVNAKINSDSTVIESETIDLNGVLTINGVPFINHKHNGVTTGGGISGGVV